MNTRIHVGLSLVALLIHPHVSQSQWTRVLDSTIVVSFAANTTHLFAGAYEEPIRVSGFRVFSSTNSGSVWTNAGPYPGGTNVNALAVSGVDLFAGTEAGILLVQGVHRSTNNGITWIAPSLHMQVYSLLVTGGKLFAGTGGGRVYLSTNSGASWTARIIGQTNTYVSAFAVMGEMLLAGTDGGGVYLSTNEGETWIPANTGLANTNLKTLVVLGSNVFVGTFGGGIFLSTNNGESWTPASNGLTSNSVFALVASTTNLFAGTFGGGVFLSTNNGASWNPVNDGLTSTNVVALGMKNDFLFAGTWNRGVWRRPLSELVPTGSGPASLPGHFSLDQNYPNPFNPGTTIRYAIAARSQVTLKVFDILGREVASLVNGVEEPGYKSVLWDAGNANSGVYFYQLRAGSFVAARRMSVIR